MSKEFITSIVRKCKYCGNENLILEPRIAGQDIMTADQVALKCADCGKWLKWCPKDERKFYLKKVDKDQQIAEFKAENEKLQQQLKDNTKQVCEKIRDYITSNKKDEYDYYNDEFSGRYTVNVKDLNKFLNQIENGE